MEVWYQIENKPEVNFIVEVKWWDSKERANLDLLEYVISFVSAPFFYREQL